MFYAGIDVAKHHHEAVLLDESGDQQGASLRFDNSREGFTQFLQHLDALPGEIQVALEATGHYWLALYDALTDHGLEVPVCVRSSRTGRIVLNPLQVEAYRKSFLRKAKTDQKDAWMIADLLRIGRAIPCPLPPQDVRHLRELTRFRFGLVDALSNLKRQLGGILDRVFPEYAALFPQVLGATSSQVLAQAPTPEDLEGMELSALTRLIEQASRGHMGTQQAQALQQAASQSIGVRWITDAARIQIQCLLTQATVLQQNIDHVEALIKRLVKTSQDGMHLLSIPGLGPTLAAVILGELAPIRRFESTKQLVAFVGMDPSVYESGQFQATQAHISKRGSPYARRALFLAANIARLYDPQLAALYDRKIQQGKHHSVAVVAVAHRLLARIYVVLKEQRPYRKAET